MAAKSPLKTAGLAGLENPVQSMIRVIMQKLEILEKSISGFREEFAALHKKLDTRANELERVVRVEMIQNRKRKRAI